MTATASAICRGQVYSSIVHYLETRWTVIVDRANSKGEPTSIVVGNVPREDLSLLVDTLIDSGFLVTKLLCTRDCWTVLARARESK